MIKDQTKQYNIPPQKFNQSLVLMPGPISTMSKGSQHTVDENNSSFLRQTWTSIEPGSVVNKSKNLKLSAQH